jgi:hypothetical protein
MPGNLRKKLKRGGPTEREYLKAREQIIRESQICAGCHDAIDLTLKPICSQVSTAGFTVETAHEIPTTCGPECNHPKKANPWCASADHIIPVEKLPPGSPLLVSKKNLVSMHKVCNQRKGSGAAIDRPKFVSSGDWF